MNTSRAFSLLLVLVIIEFCFTYTGRIPGLEKRFETRQIPSCWTCPPGYLHYWDLGRSGPTNGDPCQCLPSNSPATTAPPGSQYCWNCPSGFTHWWKLGMAYPSNGDKCQCLPGGAAPTTRAPAPAPGGTPSCWTCPPGMLHWYELGLPQPADKCACYTVSTTKPPTATAPPGSQYCWTCPPGQTHWWKLGLSNPSNGDKCQCIASGAAPAPIATVPPESQYCWTCPAGYTHWWKLGMSAPSNGDKCQCVANGAAPAPTTRAPAPAPAPPVGTTPNCWTCPPGMLHWFELGLPQPSDKCACYSSNRPTTQKPNCWACPSGQSHWFDIGFNAPTNGDKCQCIPSAIGATTAAPVPNCWTCPSGMSHWWEQNLSQPPSGDRCQCLNIPRAAPVTEAMKRFIQYMTPTATSPGSISFSPIVAPYAPWNLPPYQLMEQLLINIKSTTNFRVIMTYGLTPNTALLAQKHGFKVLGIINLVTESSSNARAIADGIATAKQYADTVIAVACGNEVGLAYGTGSNTAAIINGCLTNVRNSGIGQPIGVVDIYNSWNQNGNKWSAVSDNVDWIGINTYPWYDNMYALPPFTCATPENAGEHTLTSVTRLENMYYPKPVILTEYGWPSAPIGGTVYNKPNAYTGKSCTYGNDYAQAQAVQNILNTFRKVQKPCNLFSGYREAWKGSNSESVEEFWGVCSGTPPYSCYNAPK